MRPQRLLPTAISLGLALTLVSCGDSDDDAGSAAVPATDAADGAVTDPVADAEATPAATGAPADAGDAPADEASTGGTCNVVATGDFTADYTGTGGIFAVNSQYWFTPEEIEASGMSSLATPLTLNCDSDDGTSVTIGVRDEAALPFAPGDVVLPDGAITMFAENGNRGPWSPDAPVTLSLTAFDDTRIAGSASYTGTSQLDGGTTVTVELTFDFENPN
jgi:hypothetical protein